MGKAQCEEKPARDKTRFCLTTKFLQKQACSCGYKKYVKENNPDFEKLQQVFDKSLQGSLNVIETVENASRIKDATKRYFMKDEIELKDGKKVVVCTQWGIFNIVKFEKIAESLGYMIQRFEMFAKTSFFISSFLTVEWALNYNKNS